MAHMFGNELKRMPLYTSAEGVEAGYIAVHDDGIVIDDGKDFKMPVHKSLIEAVSVQKALPQNKFEVNLRYYNFMGATMEMTFVLADEDYKFLSAKVSRR